MRAQQYYEFPDSGKSLSGTKAFDKVTVLDKRTNKTFVAKLKYDANVGFEQFATKGDFSLELARYCRTILERENTREKELLIIVYRFFLSELDTNLNESLEFGVVRLSADFFIKSGSKGYRLAAYVDDENTVAAFNVTKRLLKAVGPAWKHAFQLARKGPSASDKEFSYEELTQFHRDSLKHKFPFSGDLPGTVAYKHWNDFLAGRIDKTVQPEFSLQGKVRNYILKNNGKRMVSARLPVQIITKEGKAYYRYRDSYWLLERLDGNCYVNIPIVLTKYNLSAIRSYLPIGGYNTGFKGFERGQITAYYRCRIDLCSGLPVPLTELKSKADCSEHYGIY